MFITNTNNMLRSYVELIYVRFYSIIYFLNFLQTDFFEKIDKSFMNIFNMPLSQNVSCEFTNYIELYTLDIKMFIHICI